MHLQYQFPKRVKDLPIACGHLHAAARLIEMNALIIELPAEPLTDTE